jgi:putative ABC transport system substrate-binding protein
MGKNFALRLLATVLLVTGAPTEAQQTKKIPRIGFVSASGDATNSGPRVEAFRQALRDLGYVDGTNVLIDYRYLEGKTDRTPSIVAELVQLPVNVLVSDLPPAIRAAQQATKTIPIVIVTTQDPVAAGIVASLARPGGNITGVTRLTRELSGKRLELLKEIVPRVSRVGVLWVRPTPESQGAGFQSYESAAHGLKIELQSLEVGRTNPDLEGAFQTARKAHVNAVLTVRNIVLSPYRKKIADLAIKNRLPSMADGIDYVEAGCLVSYSSSDTEIFRRAATYVDKILKGAKPADLPVEQPTKFEFGINLKTAKQIGLSISDSVLFRADKVIR